MASPDRVPVLQLLLLGLMAASCVTPLLAASLQDAAVDERKFVSKPNDIKKIRNNIDKQTGAQQPMAGFNSGNLAGMALSMLMGAQPQQKQPASFEWGNLAGMALKLLVGGPTVSINGEDKADRITQLTNGEFSWTKVISLVMEVILSLVGGGDNNKIDRTDSGPSPVENILSTVIAYVTGSNDITEVNIMAKQATELLGFAVSLLDALRTSFSQRSMEARSMGSSDPMADVAVATTAMIKSYVKTYNTDDDLCMQKYLCDANYECVDGTSDAGYLFCQIGTYGMSYILERTTYTPFEIYNDAGRRGRVGEDCYKIFPDCNEI